MIELSDVSFKYVGRREPALRGLSLAIPAGQSVLVLGPSGGGKSTLGLCLNGAIPRSIAGDLTGRVRVAGTDTRLAVPAELAQRVGMVFQDPEAQFCMLSVEDEVAFGLENLAVPRSDMDGRIDRALGLVGLADRRRDRIEHLSGGQKQRLAIACALAQEPSILVLDEPTAQLDPAAAADVIALLGRLRARGDLTLVLVEHRLDDAIGLADRALVLSARGELVADGAPRTVIREQARALREAGVWMPQVSELALAVERAGRPVRPFPLTVPEAAAALGGPHAPAGCPHPPPAGDGPHPPPPSPADGRGGAQLRPAGRAGCREPDHPCHPFDKLRAGSEAASRSDAVGPAAEGSHSRAVGPGDPSTPLVPREFTLSEAERALVKIDPEPPETARNERFHEGWCAGAHGRSQDDMGGGAGPSAQDDMVVAGGLPHSRKREWGPGGAGTRPGGEGTRPGGTAPRRAPGSGPALVQVRRLTFGYAGVPESVLRDVSCELRAGELVAVVGANGAGKSTLARLMAGILRPPRGAIVVHGRDVTEYGRSQLARQVGYVFQYPEHQFVGRTALEDVAFGPLRTGMPPASAHSLARAMLADFGLERLAEAHPFTLSHGEQRRLSVASMLVLGQRVLLLDEPTFGQDERNAAMLLDKLVALAARGRAIVAVSHDMRLVAERAHRVLVMARGALVYDGTPDDLFADGALMARAGLKPPPLWELSRRLGLAAPIRTPAEGAKLLATAPTDDRVGTRGGLPRLEPPHR